jgi:hypothetical protein
MSFAVPDTNAVITSFLPPKDLASLAQAGRTGRRAVDDGRLLNDYHAIRSSKADTYIGRLSVRHALVLGNQDIKLAWVLTILATTTNYVQAHRNEMTQADWGKLGISSDIPASALSIETLNRVATVIQDRLLMKNEGSIAADNLHQVAERYREMLAAGRGNILDSLLVDNLEAIGILLHSEGLSAERIAYWLLMAVTLSDFEVVQAILDSHYSIPPHRLANIWVDAEINNKDNRIPDAIKDSKRPLSPQTIAQRILSSYNITRMRHVFIKSPLQAQLLVTAYVAEKIYHRVKHALCSCRRSHQD